MRTGVITTYFGDRGYGFIKDSDSAQFKTWFFHVKDCKTEPRIGLSVQFDTADGINGKGPVAVSVETVKS